MINRFKKWIAPLKMGRLDFDIYTLINPHNLPTKDTDNITVLGNNMFEVYGLRCEDNVHPSVYMSFTFGFVDDWKPDVMILGYGMYWKLGMKFPLRFDVNRAPKGKLWIDNDTYDTEELFRYPPSSFDTVTDKDGNISVKKDSK